MIEIHLAADGRHAHAVAVVANAGHDTCYEMPGLGVVRAAKAQRIHVGDGPRPHGEHVSHDSANTRGRALIGLDIGRMVMALHLKDRCLTVS